MTAKEQAFYSHGHHSSVVNSHARRTAQDSATFLLPHLQPHFTILDIGCGPGSITVDLAQLVPQGKVIGVDVVEDVLQKARELASQRSLTNIEFKTVDANALPYENGVFDVVFCHQVLQHVKDPVAILREMKVSRFYTLLRDKIDKLGKRVAKKGIGIVAAREADYKGFVWYPEPAPIDGWGTLYQQVARANGGEPNAGRYIRQWAKAAGFSSDETVSSWSSWFYTGESAAYWGKSWSERALYSTFASSAREHGFATDDDLKSISEAWRKWGRDDDAQIAVPSGEIICRVSA